MDLSPECYIIAINGLKHTNKLMNPNTNVQLIYNNGREMYSIFSLIHPWKSILPKASANSCMIYLINFLKLDQFLSDQDATPKTNDYICVKAQTDYCEQGP